MKKLVKIALIAVAVVVVLVVAVLALTLLNLDSIVKKGVEQGGSYALKVPVKLDSAKISIFKGRASLLGFSVANPPGFSANPALGFGEVTAEIKPSTINKNPVEIPEIVVRRPEISIEGDLGGDTNLARLQKNLEETLGPSGNKAGAPAGKTAEKPAEKTGEAGPAKRLKLDHILLENPKVSLAAKLLGQTQQKTVELGKLEIKDLAKEFPQGMTPAELSKRLLDELIRAALKDQGEVGKALQKLADKGALGTIKSVADDATKLGTEIVNDPSRATEIIKDPKKAVDSLQDVKDLKDVFKKKK